MLQAHGNKRFQNMLLTSPSFLCLFSPLSLRGSNEMMEVSPLGQGMVKKEKE